MEELLEFIETLNSTGITPESYQYFHQLFDNRTIIFNGGVDENIIERIYLPLRDFELDDSNKPITIILNSFGGSVTEGFFLANYLARYTKKVEIIVTGCAASMATVILAAGGKNENIVRKCYPSSYSLIHDGFVTIGTSENGTAQDIMEFNKTVDKDIRQFIIDNTEISADLYDSKTRYQWFLKADEMLKLNLIDEII